MRSLLLFLLVSCGSANYRPNYPVTGADAAESTFRLEVYGEESRFLGSGTAWVVGVQAEYTYLISAGHVCANPSALTYKLHSKDDAVFAVEQTMYSEDPDLCLLKYHGRLARPLLIATEMPRYGDWVSYVGAPFGLYGKGAAPYYSGRYIGSKYVGVETAPGASGSAIWTPRGVFGVLITVDSRFHHVTGFVPLQELVNFLAVAGFKYGNPTITIPR